MKVNESDINYEKPQSECESIVEQVKERLNLADESLSKIIDNVFKSESLRTYMEQHKKLNSEAKPISRTSNVKRVPADGITLAPSNKQNRASTEFKDFIVNQFNPVFGITEE